MHMTKSLYLHFLIVVSAGKLKNFVGYADRRPAVVGGPRKVQRARKKAALHLKGHWQRPPARHGSYDERRAAVCRCASAAPAPDCRSSCIPGFCTSNSNTPLTLEVGSGPGALGANAPG